MSKANHGGFLLEGVRKFGASAIFLVQLLVQSVPALARPRLIVYQIYNAGARSLIIIMLAGLFVGMVLGLQGYNLLQRFGSEDALGTAAALGITSIVVSHDVQELSSIADDSYLLEAGRVAATGTPQELAQSDSPAVHQFMAGSAEGPVRFHYPASDYTSQLLSVEER